MQTINFFTRASVTEILNERLCDRMRSNSCLHAKKIDYKCSLKFQSFQFENIKKKEQLEVSKQTL